MNVGVLIFGELSAGMEMRLQKSSRVLEFSISRLRSQNPIIRESHDLYILTSWGESLENLISLSNRLKSQIGDTPLLWLNEMSLDSVSREKVPNSIADGFLEFSEFESVIQDIILLRDLLDIVDIPGIVINQKNAPFHAPRQSSRRSFPAVLEEPDLNPGLDYSGYFALIPGLGCSRRCSHCSIVSREGFRRRMKTSVLLDRVNELFHKARIRKFNFLDHEFNDDLSDLREFCEGLLTQEIDIEWKAGFLFKPMNENLFNLLKEAGLQEVSLPLFAGSDRVFYHNNMGLRKETIRKTIKQFHSVGIRVVLDLYVGAPGESYSDYFQTMEFLSQIQPFLSHVNSVKTIGIEPNSFLDRRQAEQKISKDPGHPQAWVKQEHDHLNDPHNRDLKKLYLEKQLSQRGIYSKENTSKVDFSEIEKRRREYDESEVDVILVNSPPWGYLNPPVGIAKLSSYLRSKGRKTHLFDFNVGFFLKYEEMQRLWHVENKSYWSNDLTFDIIRYIYDRDIDEAVEEILNVPCKTIGFSCVDPKERMTVEFIKRLRARDGDLKIILGGPVCGTSEYRDIFFDKLGMEGVDVYAVGEGEDTLLEIVERLDHQESLAGLAGTVEPDEEGNWHFAPSRPKVDLWNAPITTFEEFDLTEYTCNEIILEWSRGCIGTCSFCKAKGLDGKFRSYSPEHIVESLRYYVEKYDIRDFTIADLAVNGNWKLLDKVCDAIVDSGLEVRLSAQGIPRRQMNRKVLDNMKRAGFVEMQWGVESGSDKVLKAMDKDWMFTIEEAQSVIRDSYLSGIKTCMFCMVGYPSEEDSDFQMTYDFIDRNAEYMDMVKSVNSLHIITDTPVHHMMEEFGLELPAQNYHYLWSMPGNNHEIRQERVKKLLDLIKVKDLECRETNYLEGRQFVLMEDYKSKYIPMDERVDLLRRDINTLIDYRMNEQEQWEPDEDPRENFLAENIDLIGVSQGKKAFIAPKIVEVDLSNNCNFNCVGCWCHCDHLQELKTPAQRKSHYLDYASITSLIKDLAESGTKTIQLAGPGEPFTHPQIMDIIRYIKGNGLELQIITNFSYITLEIAQELMDLKVDQITCSLWAGSEEAFVKTHPNQTANAYRKIKEVLTFIGNHKKYNYFPLIKIFNVISTLNAFDLENMVDFGLEVRADTMEFTVVDTVEGKTEFLALTPKDLELIESAFERITNRATYPDPPGRKHLEGLSEEQVDEHYEVNSKFFVDIGEYKEFDYESTNKVMTCKAGLANEKMEHDPFQRCANVFFFNQEKCSECKHFESCEIDKQDFSIKTRFFAVLGFGSFIRRARMSVMERNQVLPGPPVKTDLLPQTPFVDTLPCTIGWTYSRITTDGNVIPCCKGYEKPLGNLYENHFKHIWSDQPYQEFRFKAKNFKKSDVYFQEIGCYKACDNVGHNLEILKRMNRLKPREKKWLEEAAQEMGR
ncbi:radical SAM protein [bacterium]|nr:radical SAM protein [bacterium]